MANRTCSTVCALGVLGNSIQGINYANWHKLFHALILPVLTYGFPLYATSHHNKGLLKILQTAQNDMVRKMSRAFKTTPITPLHYLVAIPPISLTIKKLSDTFTLRIQCLPPFTLLCTLPSSHPKAAFWHPSFISNTTLMQLLPLTFPPFTFPSPPSAHTWSHPQICNNTAIKINRKSKESTEHLIHTPEYNTFHLFVHVLTTPSPPFSSCFLLFHGQTLIYKGVTCNASRPHALFSALCEGLTYAHLSNHVRIFLPDLSLTNYLFHMHKHSLLLFSCLFSSLLLNFLSQDPLHHADLLRYSIKWAGLPGKAIWESFVDEEQRLIFPCPPTPLLNPKACLIQEWANLYLTLHREGCVWQSIIIPDGRPPPFCIGTLSCKDHHTFSAAIQLACDHAFTATYSNIFRANASDNTLCPCNYNTQPPSPLSHQSFDQLMAIQYQQPRSPSTSPPPLPLQWPSPRKRNTTQHVLFECHLHSSPRRCIFGRFPFDAYIFGTEDSGRKLSKFQHTTNTLLRPLPPRPDPS